MAYRQAEELSAPGEDESGPTRTLWRQLAEHFVLNLDEANYQANAGSDKIVGVKGRRKHEKNKNDSLVSVTVVECGSAAGEDGPSIFMPAGQEIPAYLQSQFGSSEWLKRAGAPANSFVQMTPSGFMTNQAWDDSAEKLAKGIRQMPVIKDHPDFWVVKHLDGFKSHVMTYEVQNFGRQRKFSFFTNQSGF